MIPAFTDLRDAADWYDAWLRDAVLPLWADVGVDDRRGSFYEALELDGAAHEAPRRTRVQTRQVFVYALAARAGYPGPFLATAGRAYDFFVKHYRRPDGLFVRVCDGAGRVVDPTPTLYEQAFSILCMAALYSADPTRTGLPAEAATVRAALDGHRHAAGGFRELDGNPFQANAHMHLLEASLAWDDQGVDGWGDLADEVVALALARFIDHDRGVLREFFDADWRPLGGPAGLIEPGHLFEWAWLLERWAVRRDRQDVSALARRMYAAGNLGVDAARDVAIDSLWDDLSIRDTTARLWPQTERLKAALTFGDTAGALSAARGLARYLDMPVAGTWRDRMLSDGGFADAPAPASSLYHILVACLMLVEAGRAPCS